MMFETFLTETARSFVSGRRARERELEEDEPEPALEPELEPEPVELDLVNIPLSDELN